MTDILKLNLGKALTIASLLSILFTGVWATAGAHNRLAASERRADQQELWINEQTKRIERLEDALHSFNITLARIDENVKQLRREKTKE